jgi:hypothetical protein
MFPAPHVIVVVVVVVVVVEVERRAWDARLLGASEGALTGRTPARISPAMFPRGSPRPRPFVASARII